MPVLLTEKEWEAVYAAWPRDIPVTHPALQEFSQLSKNPQYIVEGTSLYREVAWKCRCWMCNYMLAQPVITGYHLYIVLLNKITAGGEPRYQVN